MPVSVRGATLDDIPAILAIEQAAPLAAHWTAKQYKSRVEDGYLIVAVHDGKLRGFLCARIVAGEWEIENVVVTQEFRRQGVAARLMQALTTKWEACGGTAILLEVRESNVAARTLYEKFGLTAVGRRRDYYQDPLEDAILFKREM